MDIVSINDDLKDKLKEFLLGVPTINDVDDNIIENSLVVLDKNEIMGAVSYETYYKRALIRYFVFKKNLKNDVVMELFKKLEDKAYLNNVKELYCVVNNNMVESLFTELGFNKLTKSKLYINESQFNLEKNDDAFIMYKPIEVIS